MIHIPGGWGPDGHEWFMGVTPYPNSNALFENPSLLSSTDGDTWVVPTGVTNPLHVPTVEVDPTHAYWPDPSLVFDGSRLHYFWQGHWYSYSDDGAIFSTPVQIEHLPGDLSPSILLEDGVWKMWSIWKGDPDTDANVCLYRTAAAPTGPWSDPVVVNMAPPAGRDLWHITVDKAFGLYFAFVVDCSLGSSGGGSRLYLAISDDGFNWPMSRAEVIVRVPAAWDSTIYRTSMVELAGVLHVFYSARSAGGVWHSGRTILRRR